MQNDEQEILDVIASWRQSLESKNVEALLSDYSANAVLYDACPPYKTEGADGIADVWNSCLPYFPDSFKSEHRDLTIHVSGDLAIAFGLHHFIPEPPDHPCGQSWMRVTIGFLRQDGRWTVIHEHVSQPFNPITNQVWQITDPDNLEKPDYSQMEESAG